MQNTQPPQQQQLKTSNVLQTSFTQSLNNDDKIPVTKQLTVVIDQQKSIIINLLKEGCGITAIMKKININKKGLQNLLTPQEITELLKLKELKKIFTSEDIQSFLLSTEQINKFIEKVKELLILKSTEEITESTNALKNLLMPEEEINKFKEIIRNRLAKKETNKFKEEQLNEFIKKQINKFTEEQKNKLIEEQINKLTEKQINKFTDERIKKFSTEIINKLTIAQLKQFNTQLAIGINITDKEKQGKRKKTNSKDPKNHYTYFAANSQKSLEEIAQEKKERQENLKKVSAPYDYKIKILEKLLERTSRVLEIKIDQEKIEPIKLNLYTLPKTETETEIEIKNAIKTAFETALETAVETESTSVTNNKKPIDYTAMVVSLQKLVADNKSMNRENIIEVLTELIVTQHIKSEDVVKYLLTCLEKMKAKEQYDYKNIVTFLSTYLEKLKAKKEQSLEDTVAYLSTYLVELKVKEPQNIEDIVKFLSTYLEELKAKEPVSEKTRLVSESSSESSLDSYSCSGYSLDSYSGSESGSEMDLDECLEPASELKSEESELEELESDSEEQEQFATQLEELGRLEELKQSLSQQLNKPLSNLR